MVTARQQTILNHIVGDYVRDAAPIASDALARRHSLGVSAATVRNEVAALEEWGYISRPHKSAGSVPEDKAYRLYVESFLSGESDGSGEGAPSRIPPRAREAISDGFAVVQHDVDRWGDVAAALIAQMMDNLGIATPPKTGVSRVRHVELLPVREALGLLIVVMEQTRLRKQLLRFDEPVDRVYLEWLSSRVRSLALGLTAEEIEERRRALSGAERRAVDATMLILREEDEAGREDYHVSGLRNLLDQPEFVDYEMALAIVQGVEDGSLVEAALDEAPVGRVVRVVIGREHAGDALRSMSVVICRYGVPGRALGTVGVVGPTRMEYDRAISGVRFISTVMNGMAASVYGAA